MRSGQKNMQEQMIKVQKQLDDMKDMIAQLSHQDPNGQFGLGGHFSLGNVIGDDAGNEFWANNFGGLFAVDVNAFTQAVKRRFKCSSDAMLVSLRRSIDTDGNGSITLGEFNTFCAKKGFSKFFSDYSTSKVPPIL
jgi:hypothetical protein